jgi:hypothetical protein
MAHPSGPQLSSGEIGLQYSVLAPLGLATPRRRNSQPVGLLNDGLDIRPGSCYTLHLSPHQVFDGSRGPLMQRGASDIWIYDLLIPEPNTLLLFHELG